MYTMDDLSGAKLPVARVWTDDFDILQAEFSRPLTEDELVVFSNLQRGIANIPITLSPSQQIILANGEDAAEVTMTGSPGELITFTINGVPQTVTLSALGKETIEMTCDTPNTTIVILAGTAKAVIYAVEIPL